jgi:hypothetical protein
MVVQIGTMIAVLGNLAMADEPPSSSAIFQQALAVARSEADLSDRMDAMVSIATAQAVSGDWPAAWRTLEEISPAEKAAIDDDLLQRIAALQAGSWIEALRPGPVHDIERWMVPGDPEDRLSNLPRIADGPSDLGAALATASQIDSPDRRLWAIWSIVHPLIEASRWSDLHLPLRRLLASVEQTRDPVTSAKMLAVVAWVRAMAGDRPGAAASLEAALAKERTLEDDEQRAEALLTIGAALHATGDERAAADSIGESVRLATAGRSDHVLHDIAVWRALAGDISGARATANLVEDDEARASALLHVAFAAARNGDSELDSTLHEAAMAADRTSDIMLQGIIAAALDDPPRRLAVLSAGAAMQFECVWRSAVLSLAAAPAIAAAIDPLVDISRNATDPEQQLVALWCIAWPLILADDRPALVVPLQEALRIPVRDRQDALFEDFASFVIAWAQAKVGDPIGARKTLDEAGVLIDDPDSPEWMRGEIALVQQAIGDTAGALKTAEQLTDAEDRARALAWIAAGAPFPVAP